MFIMGEGESRMEEQSIKSVWIQAYIDSPEKRAALYKRTLLIVVVSQIFSGAGLAAGITVGALIAQDMLGTESLSGLPIALFTLGSAGAALLVGRLSQTYGRRVGLSAGFMAGGAGALGVIFAALSDNILLLFVFLVMYGAGTATNLQARYAGTDLANAKQRATAVSIALVSTTFGAVAGPSLVEPMGSFAEAIGVPSLSGPFILAAAAYFMAGLILAVFLRPDPFLVAKALAQEEKQKGSVEFPVSAVRTDKRGVTIGAIIMVSTQMIMIAVMTMTPVHMGQYGHPLGSAGLVIGAHLGAMYLPSVFTGMIADKVGRRAMSAAAALTLLVACALAAFASGESFSMILISLVLLGVGWNFGLITGTAVIVDATNPETRAKTQGAVDVWIAIGGAAGGALSGVITAQFGFSALSIGCGILSLLLIPLALYYPTEKIASPSS